MATHYVATTELTWCGKRYHQGDVVPVSGINANALLTRNAIAARTVADAPSRNGDGKGQQTPADKQQTTPKGK